MFSPDHIIPCRKSAVLKKVQIAKSSAENATAAFPDEKIGANLSFDCRKIIAQLDKLPIDDRFQQHLLAAENRLSVNQFVGIFQKEMGMTPKRYFHRRRVEWCRKQLLLGSTPIKAVAIDLGFTYLSDFSTWVKKHLGAAPRAYRHMMHYHSQSSHHVRPHAPPRIKVFTEPRELPRQKATLRQVAAHHEI